MSLGDVEREEEERNTRWEGYANYELVSGRIARTIDDAVEAYAMIDGYHSENVTLPGDIAAEGRASIMTAAMMLQSELERERGSVDLYDRILQRWEGEEGFIKKMDDARLAKERPGWLFDFVQDIRKAGWELGYLQAGRTEAADPEDPVEAESEDMF